MTQFIFKIQLFEQISCFPVQFDTLNYQSNGPIHSKIHDIRKKKQKGFFENND